MSEVSVNISTVERLALLSFVNGIGEPKGKMEEIRLRKRLRKALDTRELEELGENLSVAGIYYNLGKKDLGVDIPDKELDPKKQGELIAHGKELPMALVVSIEDARKLRDKLNSEPLPNLMGDQIVDVYDRLCDAISQQA